MSNDSLVADSWTELIQIGCQILEVEAIQPLRCATLEETLSSLKRLWAYAVLCEKHSDSVVQLCKSPFARDHPIGRVLASLLLKQIASPAAALVPIRPLMPFFESCQLALLWAIAGEEEGSSFGLKLLPFLDLPFLWCREQEFSEEEMQLSVVLLKRAFGQLVDAPKHSSPFFCALAKSSPCWEMPISLPHRVHDPELGLILHRGEAFTGAVTLAGEGTSLGAFCAEGVQVRAFGPQVLPFSEPKGFGILRQPDSQPIERWTAVATLPEVWMEVQTRFEREEMGISVRFLGQNIEKPIYFCFYIKAAQCQIAEEKFLPCTLKRYQGEAKLALFGDKLGVESLLPGKMELIPLAGEGGFWNCNFLLACEVSSFEGRGEYRFKVI